MASLHWASLPAIRVGRRAPLRHPSSPLSRLTLASTDRAVPCFFTTSAPRPASGPKHTAHHNNSITHGPPTPLRSQVHQQGQPASQPASLSCCAHKRTEQRRGLPLHCRRPLAIVRSRRPPLAACWLHGPSLWWGEPKRASFTAAAAHCQPHALSPSSRPAPHTLGLALAAGDLALPFKALLGTSTSELQRARRAGLEFRPGNSGSDSLQPTLTRCRCPLRHS